MSAYVLPIKVLFQHCDPAGIVFYPRYLEMVNQVMETWFETEIGYSYAAMHLAGDVGVPTVSLQVTFSAPSRIGEVLEFAMRVVKIGRTSLGVVLVGTCAGELRLEVSKTIIFIDKDSGRPIPWQTEMATAFARFEDAAPEKLEA